MISGRVQKEEVVNNNLLTEDDVLEPCEEEEKRAPLQLVFFSRSFLHRHKPSCREADQSLYWRHLKAKFFCPTSGNDLRIAKFVLHLSVLSSAV